MTTVPDLWPHQEAAILATLLAIKAGHESGLVILPTGVGKTGFALSLGRRLEVPVLFLVHRDELVSQTVAAAGRFWPEASVASVEAGTTDWDVPDLFRDGRLPDLVVGMVPSLVNRLQKIAPDRFGLVVQDEAHLSVAPTFRRVLEYFLPGFRLGLTATPERLDGQGLADLYGKEPVYYYPLRQAIEEGRLVRIESKSVQTRHNLDGVESRAGDLREGELSRAVNTEERNELVVRAHEKFAPDRRAVAFCVDVDHAMFLALMFRSHGVACEPIVGSTGKDARRLMLQEFAAGKLQVLTTCEVLTMGYDDPGLSCILMARPTESRALYIQCVGRGLRLAPGKTDCLLIDFTDNASRHKLVCAMDLLGRDRKPSPASPSDDELRQHGPRSDISMEAPIVAWKLQTVCPWPSLPSLDDYAPTAAWQGDPCSAGQLRLLARLGMRAGRELAKGEASHLIGRALEYEAAFPSPATNSQRWLLEQAGLWQDGMSKRQASRLIGDLKTAEARGIIAEAQGGPT